MEQAGEKRPMILSIACFEIGKDLRILGRRHRRAGTTQRLLVPQRAQKTPTPLMT